MPRYTFAELFTEVTIVLQARPSICLFRTLRDRDVAREPTWMYRHGDSEKTYRWSCPYWNLTRAELQTETVHF